jgi:hypothetical protein
MNYFERIFPPPDHMPSGPLPQLGNTDSAPSDCPTSNAHARQHAVKIENRKGPLYQTPVANYCDEFALKQRFLWQLVVSAPSSDFMISKVEGVVSSSLLRRLMIGKVKGSNSRWQQKVRSAGAASEADTHKTLSRQLPGSHEEGPSGPLYGK